MLNYEEQSNIMENEIILTNQVIIILVLIVIDSVVFKKNSGNFWNENDEVVYDICYKR